MRFIDGKESGSYLLQPSQRVAPGRPLRRKIEKPVSAFAGSLHDFGLLLLSERTVEYRGRNAHLSQLGGLVLHERNQRRDHHCGATRNHCRQLVTKRFAATGGHDNTSIVPREQAADDALLQRPERTVSPVAAQRNQQVRLRGHKQQYRRRTGTRDVNC